MEGTDNVIAVLLGSLTRVHRSKKQRLGSYGLMQKLRAVKPTRQTDYSLTLFQLQYSLFKVR